MMCGATVFEDALVQEHQRVEGLVLGGGGEPAAQDQVVEKRLDVGRMEVARVLPEPVTRRGESQILSHLGDVRRSGGTCQPEPPADEFHLVEKSHTPEYYPNLSVMSTTIPAT
jgi:hypothetical protein